MHNHNEQFLQVGLLDRALISLGLALSPPSTSLSSDLMSLGLALSPPSTSVSSDFMVLVFFLLKLVFLFFVTLPCRGIGPLTG